MRATRFALASVFAAITMGSTAARVAAAESSEPGEPWSPIQRDFPFQQACVVASWPEGNTAYKSVAIRLGPAAAVSFDTDTLRLSAAWTGAFLTPTSVSASSEHGTMPAIAGDQKVGTKMGLGWADANGSFADPRKPQPYGPIPESIGRWQGLYTVGDAVVLAYKVHGADVYEQPSAIVRDGRTGFVRTFRIEHASKPMSLLVADVPGAKPAAPSGKGNERGGVRNAGLPASVLVEAGGRSTAVALVGAPADAKLEVVDGSRIVLRLPAKLPATPFKLVMFQGPSIDVTAGFPPLVGGTPQLADFHKGGTLHWPTAITTKGVLGADKGAYTVDRITTPFPGAYGPIKDSPREWRDNPFRRRIMIGGFDFFADGKRAAVSTWEGDVWIVSGIDDKLERVQWRRFASGLYEPLGLKIVDDTIYVNGRDQLTRLHDLNKDGEADFYENWNNQVTATTGFHEFQFDLQTDKAGNFYTTKAGPVRSGGRGFGGGGGNGDISAFAGTLQRISKDGKKREIIATGFRAPNGIGIGPNGEITTGDNEGTWTPACPINWVKPGGFYGVEDLAHRSPIPAREPPLAWLPMSYDNSGGGQVWVTSKKWGPLQGELLHLSYGKSAIYRVLKQKAGDLMQGGVVRVVGGADAAQYTGIPQQLTSSAMRGRFNPADGQLYVVGLRGWQTNAANNTGFDRIRYTGKPVYTVTSMFVDAAGVHLTFSHPLDPSSADPRNFSGERWNYKRTSNYGSPDYKVSKPNEEGRDKLDVAGAVLSPDGKTIIVAISDLKPVNQMVLKFKLKAKDGTAIAQSIAHTVHVVPPAKPADAKLVAQAIASRKQSVATAQEPGLEVTFTGTANGASSDATTASAVRLYVAAGKSPSPFVAPGPFRAVWEGTIATEIARPYRFQAELAGSLTLEINGKKVLEATGNGAATEPSAAVPLNQGENKLRAVFVSPAKGDAIVRLGWLEPTFGFEPIPESAFAHEPRAALAEASLARTGRALFLESRCARCHALPAGSDALPDLKMDAPDLSAVGARLEYGWMRRWIASPHDLNKSTRMPAVVRWDDAVAIASYLVTLRDGGATKPTLTALAPNPPAAAADAEAPQGGEASLFEKLRCNACHPAPGWEAAEETRVPLGGVRDKYGDDKRLAAFLRSPDAAYAWTRMPNFRLNDAEATELARFLLERARPTNPEKPSADHDTIARGKELVETRGCLGCHALKGASNRLRASDAETMRGKLAAGTVGCLGPESGKAPRFTFTPTERSALSAFLKVGYASLSRHVPAEFAARQVDRLGCASCHSQIAGIPSVEQVGGKLRPEWVSAFVSGHLPYKPRAEHNAAGGVWMEARMPAFPRYADALAEGLAAEHGYPSHTAPEPPVDRALAKVGGKLVSANGGLACVTCHAAGSAPPTQVFEVEGINLAHAGERLLKPYFNRWMRNPTRVDPQTKMPAFFDEEGKSALGDVLGGDAKKQIEAIWQYMRLGPKMPKPDES